MNLALPKPVTIKEYVPAEEVLHIDEGDAQRLEGALINTYGRVLVKVGSKIIFKIKCRTKSSGCLSKFNQVQY